MGCSQGGVVHSEASSLGLISVTLTDKQEAIDEAKRQADLEGKVSACKEAKRDAREATCEGRYELWAWSDGSDISYEPVVIPRRTTADCPIAVAAALDTALRVATEGQYNCPWFFTIVKGDGLKALVRDAFESGLTEAPIVLALSWRGESEEVLQSDTTVGRLQTAINRAKLSTVPLAVEGRSRAISKHLSDARASDVRILMPIFTQQRTSNDRTSEVHGTSASTQTISASTSSTSLATTSSSTSTTI